MTRKQEQAIKELPQTGFHFSEEAHLYVLDGKPLTGVTTILSVIAKPALIQWSADEAVKHLGWYNEKYVTEEEKPLVQTLLKAQLDLIKLMNEESFYAFLSEARIKHAKRKTSAATIGTDVHAVIEEIVKDAIKNFEGLIIKDKVIGLTNDNPLVQKFLDWAIENKIKFLESEKRLYSKKYFFAGTTDLLIEKDGRKFIADIKTASGIYPEMFYQMAGYQIMLEEMGVKDIVGSIVIRCGKDGSFETAEHYDYETDKKAFLGALEIYRINEYYDKIPKTR